MIYGKELETARDMRTRPVAAKVKSLPKERLEALRILGSGDGHATFEHMWSLEYIVNGTEAVTKERLLEHSETLVANEVLKRSEAGSLSFNGDEFDRIYTKYVAREKKVSLGVFAAAPIELLWVGRMTRLSLESQTDVLGDQGNSSAELLSIAGRLADKDEKSDIFVEQPSLPFELYQLMIRFRSSTHIGLVDVRLKFPWIDVRFVFHAEGPSKLEAIEALCSELRSMADRTAELGGELVIGRLDLPVASVETLSEKVKMSANESLRNRIAQDHVTSIVRVYVTEEDLDNASTHADLAYGYLQKYTPHLSNNLGYIFMALGDDARARALLESAAVEYKEEFRKALPRYNLGMLAARKR